MTVVRPVIAADPPAGVGHPAGDDEAAAVAAVRVDPVYDVDAAVGEGHLEHGVARVARRPDAPRRHGSAVRTVLAPRAASAGHQVAVHQDVPGVPHVRSDWRSANPLLFA
jgi:hypothetical protein